ncbi:ribose 1,5-bisphosphate isomerase [Pyrococcus furiosus DSM 3638]|uniref:Thiamine thiazole synthase n=3 Tax=Pyrococcus furiosus TaxID=2261 RepID=THI4_PYRFU|nr:MULTISPECIES: sulfide-dependent adenosine diphosphate thiazole synthase [Pyrococcus]Q8U0Q5.1 RecName: Full=Thiamine thiazole synthase [Pyrococcus furiosus DSM 3638]AAL81654.1 thiamine biosynthetic enzyme [Pyrococcus furiosus DSM 3638]AFN04312.1 ribulose-1,5-biphosphate synthetase [Pyrococcus furiosus COM1]MDK2869024.1 sulfide-dependent adenosine diphosphate thiazole synthase [Pyrococcus sp.]QEK79154.1 ribose 1,5-bisphosphate isomerase [Pyrococcus furiosus DSM 3638]
MLKDVVISRAIVESYFKDLLNNLELDVAIVGAGPSGMVAGYYLAKGGAKVAIFEKKLSIGGGIWGGGMGFNKIVVQEEAKEILDEFDIRYEEFEKGYYVADAIEVATTIASKTVKAGVKIFNMVEVEDLVVKDDRVSGIVINWTPVKMTGLHVDPLTVEAKYVIDSTGHGAQVTQFLLKRGLIEKIPGEGAMWAEMGEKLTVENTKEVFPGLYVTGMAANAVSGAPRMGPIFGGMFLSGRKAAMEILQKLGL